MNNKVFTTICGFISLLIAFLSYLICFLPSGDLEIVLLDIGQGDGIFIRTPRGQHLLIDGGPGNKAVSEISTLLPFYDRKIDLLVLTHPDRDHVEGLIDVVKYHSVKNLLLTGIHSKSPFYKEFLRNIAPETRLIFAESKEDLIIEPDLYLDIIFPFSNIQSQQFTRPNNSSIVAKLTFGGEQILLTGDIEKEIEEKILQSQQNLKSSLLKVAHHGSKSSSTDAFLQAVSAQTALIQAGKNNSHGHPHEIVLRRLKAQGFQKIIRTDLRGRVLLSIDKYDGIKIPP
jgi:competence protein ComEC